MQSLIKIVYYKQKLPMYRDTKNHVPLHRQQPIPSNELSHQ